MEEKSSSEERSLADNSSLLWSFLQIAQVLKALKFMSNSLLSVMCIAKTCCQIALVAVINLSMYICNSGILLTSQHAFGGIISFKTYCFYLKLVYCHVSWSLITSSGFALRFLTVTISWHVSLCWSFTSGNNNKRLKPCFHKGLLFGGRIEPFLLTFLLLMFMGCTQLYLDNLSIFWKKPPSECADNQQPISYFCNIICVLWKFFDLSKWWTRLAII